MIILHKCSLWLNNITKLLVIVNNLQTKMTNMKISTLLILVIMFASITYIKSQTEFTKRNHFSLGENVTVAKFSPDYTLLAVIRHGQNKIFSYNPHTF